MSKSIAAQTRGKTAENKARKHNKIYLQFSMRLKYESKIALKLNPSEFKRRCVSIRIETNIFRISFNDRQVGLLVQQLKFLPHYNFEIIKRGDFLNAFKSGRGIVKGHLIEKENNSSILNFVIGPNYNELVLSLLLFLIPIIYLAFGNSDTKYLISAGMIGILILVFSLQIVFIILNLKRLRIEFLKMIEMIEKEEAPGKSSDFGKQ